MSHGRQTGISIQVEVEPREDSGGWNYFKYMETLPQAQRERERNFLQLVNWDPAMEGPLSIRPFTTN